MSYSEYRVTWLRKHWAPTTWPRRRVFATRASAWRFFDSMKARQDVDGEFRLLELHRRAVGRWQEVER